MGIKHKFSMKNSEEHKNENKETRKRITMVQERRWPLDWVAEVKEEK